MSSHDRRSTKYPWITAGLVQGWCGGWFGGWFGGWCGAAIPGWVSSDDVLGFLVFFKDFIYLLLDRGEGMEKERERNINVWLPLMHPPPETQPKTQACALTGN